jgi:hypothetical protein
LTLFMDKLEIKQGSFIQQTQYFIPVEIDLSVVPARLGISKKDPKLSLSELLSWMTIFKSIHMAFYVNMS